MTDNQDETLAKQTENSDQPDSIKTPASPMNEHIEEAPLDDEETEVMVDNAPIPPQFQSPYFPNGVYEDAKKPEDYGISYDPFAVQTDAGEDPEHPPKRKVGILLGAVVLVLIAALVYGLVTGRLVMPF